MDPSNPLDAKWRLVTTLLHLLAVSILSMCIARRTFFRIRTRQTRVSVNEFCIQSASIQNDLQQRRRNGNKTVNSPLVTMGFSPRFFNHNFLLKYKIETTYARLSAFLVFASSLCFVIVSAILVLGVGVNTNQGIDNSYSAETILHPTSACVALIYLCIFCYGATKVYIYMFLVERVYLVVSAGSTRPRRRTLPYKFGMVGIVVYVVLLVLVTIGRIAKAVSPQSFLHPPFEEGNMEGSNTGTSHIQYIEGICTIGIKPYGTIPFMIYDIVLTVLLTILFAFPLMSTGEVGNKQHRWIRWCLLRLRGEEAEVITQTPTPLPPFPQSSQVQVQHATSQSLSRSSPSQHFVEDIGMSVRPGELRCLAIRSIISSTVALTSSAINIIILTSNKGQEEATNCMRWCLADVLINCLAIFFVMRGRDEGWKKDTPMGRLSESIFGVVLGDKETDHNHKFVHGPNPSNMPNVGTETGANRISTLRPQRNAHVRSLPGCIISPISAVHRHPDSGTSQSTSIKQPSCPWTTSSASLPLPKRNGSTLDWHRHQRNEEADSPATSTASGSHLYQGLLAISDRRSMDLSQLRRHSITPESYSRTNRLSLHLPISNHGREFWKE